MEKSRKAFSLHSIINILFRLCESNKVNQSKKQHHVGLTALETESYKFECASPFLTLSLCEQDRDLTETELIFSTYFFSSGSSLPYPTIDLVVVPPSVPQGHSLCPL